MIPDVDDGDRGRGVAFLAHAMVTNDGSVGATGPAVSRSMLVRLGPSPAGPPDRYVGVRPKIQREPSGRVPCLRPRRLAAGEGGRPRPISHLNWWGDNVPTGKDDMTLAEPLLKTGEFGPGDSEWLHLLVGDWQLIADLAQGDLVLWFPEDFRSGDTSGRAQGGPAANTGFLGMAHVRPSTAQTVFHRDMVGLRLSSQVQTAAHLCWYEQATQFLDHVDWNAESAMRVVLYPLVRNGRTIAVLSLHHGEQSGRMQGRLDTVFRETAREILSMVARGAWPDFSASSETSRGNPRVSDGVIRLDAEGRVTFASPNAVSVYRRLGFADALTGRSLADLTRDLLPIAEKADETLPLVLTGRMPWRGEVGTDRVSVTFRAVPLRRQTRRGEERFGALLLCRDVTELRRRELELMTKDATIREIHHRVKNNLQTVSALLRLQARRMTSREGKQGLEQAMRRVATIAMVHEALSQGLTQSVDFDDLINRQFHLAAEVASPGQAVSTSMTGGFGKLPSELATPLALIINEIVANAVEHGLDGNSGTVSLDGRREDAEAGPELVVTIGDDGIGMGDSYIEESGVSAYRPPSDGEGLGMQIVRTLVASELKGSIVWRPRAGGGTEVVITAKIPDGSAERN